MRDSLFNPEHMIWQYANYHDELDDILPNVEYLIGQWEAREYETGQPFFKDRREIHMASLLLHDDLLPDAARKAFSYLMLDAIIEADDKKIKLQSLYVSPPKRGRKSSVNLLGRRFETHRLINKEGCSASEAYKKIADKHCVSVDTIRRDYERNIKKRAPK